ncbi:hypothetical protein KW805_01950 [Candidatus Pacearchaeota archaeon]|nr:hypothetical protein [Candidatus Pacearchaeota archaeon]
MKYFNFILIVCSLFILLLLVNFSSSYPVPMPDVLSASSDIDNSGACGPFTTDPDTYIRGGFSSRHVDWTPDPTPNNFHYSSMIGQDVGLCKALFCDADISEQTPEALETCFQRGCDICPRGTICDNVHLTLSINSGYLFIRGYQGIVGQYTREGDPPACTIGAPPDQNPQCLAYRTWECIEYGEQTVCGYFGSPTSESVCPDGRCAYYYGTRTSSNFWSEANLATWDYNPPIGDDGVLAHYIDRNTITVTATSEACPGAYGGPGVGRTGTTTTTLVFDTDDLDRDHDQIADFYDWCPDIPNHDTNPKYQPYGEATCNDGVDNDCNGLTDCADPRCAVNPDNPSTSICKSCTTVADCDAPSSSCKLVRCSVDTGKCEYQQIAGEYSNGLGDHQCNVHTECMGSACVMVLGPGQNECNELGASCQPKHAVCDNGQCIVQDGEGVNACIDDVDCGVKHSECQIQFGHLYQCVQVNGPGPNQCSGPAFSSCDPFHTECNPSGACVSVLGPGENRCNYNQQCNAQHADCVNSQCQLVNGPGLDTCSLETSCISTYAQCNENGQCVVAQGTQSDECSSTADCDSSHTECYNNACRAVDGPGYDECTIIGTSCQPKHAECRNDACTLVDGVGPNRCVSTKDCIKSYGACENNQCISKKGIGVSECIMDTQCVGEKHTVCNNNDQCIAVNGAGEDMCSSANDCKNSHTDCENEQCAVVPGEGIDTCTLGASCSPMYAKCVSNACVAVAGTNADECTRDSDCGVNGGYQVTAAYWTDFQGNILTPADRRSSLGDVLHLIAETRGVPEGTQIEFDIREQDQGLNPDDQLDLGLTAPTNASGVAQLQWIPTLDNYNAADDSPFFSEYSDNQIEFFFRASAVGSGFSSSGDNVSDIRNVTNTGGNTAPFAHIEAPIHRQVYFVNTQLDFKVMGSDAQGPIEGIEWTIEEEPGFSSSSATFTHTFSSPGQKTVLVRIKDSDGVWGEDQIAILVIASPGMLTYINKPNHHEIVVNESFKIDYSANDSYVLDAGSQSCPTVTCLAGNCPQQTQNVPTSCSGSTQLSVTNGPKGFNSLNFSWNFDDGHENVGDGVVEGTQTYGAPSRTFNDKKADLGLNYNNGALQSSASRVFTLLGKSQCMGGQFVVLTNDEGFLLEKKSTADIGVCKGLDGLTGTQDDCCPGGQICSDVSEGSRCILSDYAQCSDYADAGTCTLDPAGVGDPERAGSDGRLKDPSGNDCGTTKSDGTIVQCNGCKWKDTIEADDAVQTHCYLEKHYETSTKCAYNCATQAAESECVNGLQSVSVTGDVSELSELCAQQGITPSCTSSSDSVPCGQAIALPFFSARNTIATIIIIVAIYVFYLILRKKPSHARRKK